MMKKAKFNIRIWNLENKIFDKVEVEGYVLDESYAKIGVYKSEYSGWKVIEYYSGALICNGDTRKQAISRASSKVAEHSKRNNASTKDYIQGLVNMYIESHGPANGKWYTRLVKVSKEEYDKITSHARKEKTIVDGEGITYRIKAVGFHGVLLGVEYVGVSGGICMIKKRIRR